MSGGSSKKTGSSSRNDKNPGQIEDDDFMSNIEAQIANVLKKDGVEPPMPTIRKLDLDHENDNDRKVGRGAGTRKRRRRKEKDRDHKKESTSSKVNIA